MYPISGIFMVSKTFSCILVTILTPKRVEHQSGIHLRKKKKQKIKVVYHSTLLAHISMISYCTVNMDFFFVLPRP